MAIERVSVTREEIQARSMKGVRPLTRGSLAILVILPLTLGIVAGGMVTRWLDYPTDAPVSGAQVSYALRAFTAGFRGDSGPIAGVTNPVLEAKLGDTVTITVTNGETIRHNFENDAFQVRSPDIAASGDRVVVTFLADKEGTFAYYCAYHIATMSGTLRVGPGTAGTPGPVKPVDQEFIGREPTDVPPSITRSAPATVDIFLEAKEVTSYVERWTPDGAVNASFTYWTFDGKVPGPFFRVRVGDTVVVHFRNNETSTMMHSVDFHAVTGPGGGMAATETMPGENRSFSFMALVPGLFVYHCASAHIPSHISMGMYGLILVQPAPNLPTLDANGRPILEFYVMQGDIYSKWPVHTEGHQEFDPIALVAEHPTYVVFNGAYRALTGTHALTANVNDTVRIYFGVGGPNLISSFHVIGEIFDRVWNLGDLTDPPMQGVQTVLVPPGGAVVVEFGLQVPGNYLLVDHSLVRAIDKGALGILVVTGPSNPTIFKP